MGGMMRGKFISYLRVSTDKQGERGYGLDAQRKAVADYLNGGSWELLGEYVEVESVLSLVELMVSIGVGCCE